MAYGDRDYGSSVAVGTVLGRAFGVLAGNPMTVFGISFLFVALPQALMGYFGTFETGGNAAAETGRGLFAVAYLLIFMLLSGLTQAALVRATGAFLSGRTAGLGECLSVGIAKALPTIAVMILFIIGFVIGLFVLFFPGIMLLVRWAVVLPALVEEDTGVMESFTRSGYLTKGSRWKILGLLFLVMLINWLVVMVAAIPTLMAGSLTQVTVAPSVAGLLLGLVSSTVMTGLWAAVVTSLYFTLRENREGPQTERLAEVFA